jgi:hypothetical protein
LGDHRDGINRYELKGAITPFKHAALSDYEKRGVDCSSFKVIASVRHPVDRAVSAYFSPNRWARKNPDGSWRIERPSWDPGDFYIFLARFKPIADYLETSAGMCCPDFLIRFESLAEDYRHLVLELGLDPSKELPLRNRSAADASMKKIAIADPIVRNAVYEAHRVDFALFDYVL